MVSIGEDAGASARSFCDYFAGGFLHDGTPEPLSKKSVLGNAICFFDFSKLVHQKQFSPAKCMLRSLNLCGNSMPWCRSIFVPGAIFGGNAVGICLQLEIRNLALRTMHRRTIHETGDGVS